MIHLMIKVWSTEIQSLKSQSAASRHLKYKGRIFALRETPIRIQLESQEIYEKSFWTQSTNQIQTRFNKTSQDSSN